MGMKGGEGAVDVEEGLEVVEWTEAVVESFVEIDEAGGGAVGIDSDAVSRAEAIIFKVLGKGLKANPNGIFDFHEALSNSRSISKQE